MPGSGLALAQVALGPIGLERPEWLVLVPVLGLAVVWIARRSLSGLSGAGRWTALGVRLCVILLIAGALSRPSWRTQSRDVSVIAVIDASRSIPQSEQARIDAYIAQASDSGRRPDDRLGTVTVARDGIVQALPSKVHQGVERLFLGDTGGTHLADGVSMGLATAPSDTATRLVLISDGNETSGSVLRMAEAARAVGVPIDVLPVEYRYPDEVIVDELITPATVRLGETISVRIVLTATRAAVGRLFLTEAGEPIDLDPDSEGTGIVRELTAGKNVLTVQVTPRHARPQSFEAVFEPIASVRSGGGLGDSIAENNRARAITFVGAEGSVLLVAETEQERAALQRALDSAEIVTDPIESSRFPTTLAELNAYEAVVLANQPAYNLTDHQQAILRQYVHDSGGGLVMVGGPDAFGAGGWIGSPLADALPIKLDPPQKRQLPMGALAIVLDASGSMGQGVSGTFANQQQLANEASILAIETLSRLDQVSVISFSESPRVVVPLTRVDDPAGIARRVRGIGPGGGTNMFPAIEEAYKQLAASPAGVKHVIVLTDGQTTGSEQAGLQMAHGLFAMGVTISTVGVGDGANSALLERLAMAGGGRFYGVSGGRVFAELPQIFVKEAQTVRRSLIWEGEPFSPQIVNSAAEPMRGIRQVPPISGYIVAAEREGLSLVTLRGHENDPIGAIWQYGLGKVVTYTSDAAGRWGAAWLGWEGYRQFWEQHVRWAMRPGGSANVRIVTENRGDRTVLLIEALDPAGERLNYARFDARVANPDGTGTTVEVRQDGPGRYSGTIDSAEPGSYVVNLNYRAPVTDPDSGETTLLVGSAQAAISRPFADEFRSLASNAALLRQVAALTGGRELTGDPAADDLWRREGLTLPVASRPIWPAVALLAITLFLVDVGVRRVRIDPRAMAAVLRRSLGRSAPRDDAVRLESLRAVRARARAQMPAQDATRAAQASGRKFEAAADAPAPSEPIALSGEAHAPVITIAKPKKQAPAQEP